MENEIELLKSRLDILERKEKDQNEKINTLNDVLFDLQFKNIPIGKFNDSKH